MSLSDTIDRNKALIPAAVVATIALLSAPVSVPLLIAAFLMMAAAMMAPKPPNAADAGPPLANRMVTGRSGLAARRVVLGHVRTGGVVTHMQNSGADNEYLNLIVTLAGHEVQEIGDPFFDDARIPLDGSGNATGMYAGYVHCEKALGTTSQAALAALVTEMEPDWAAEGINTDLGATCVLFNGGGQHAYTSNNDADLRPAAITIRGWLRIHGEAETLTAATLLSGGNGAHWRLDLNADRTLSFTDAAGTKITGATALDLDQPYYIGVTGGVGGINLYVFTQDSTASTADATTATAYSGGAGNGSLRVASLAGEAPYATMDLQYLTILDTAEAAATVLAAKDLVQTGAEAGIIGFWPCDEATGNSADDDDINNNALTLAGPITTTFRGRGVAWAWLRLLFHEKLFAKGIPNITFEMKGAKLYDTRTGTHLWSNNAALAALSALLRPLDMAGFKAAASIAGTFTADAASDVVTKSTGDRWNTADRVRVSNTGGALPAGLAVDTDYYLIVLTDTTYKLATSAANARAETPIDITGAGTGTHTVTRQDYQVDLDTGLIDAAANVSDEMVAVAETAAVFTVPDHTNDRVLKVGNAYWGHGDLVWVSNSGGALPAGLAASTDYYVIRLTENTLKLATSLALARAGTAIDITGAGTGTHTLTRKKEPRYTCNGVYTVDRDKFPTMRDLLTAMGGDLPVVNGLFGLYAAAWRAPTLTFDEDDLVAPLGTIHSLVQARDNFNAVKGVFASPDNKWQPTEFPQITSATYEAKCSDGRVYADVAFPFTISAGMVQRLAKILNERNNRPVRTTWPGRLPCYQAQVGDTGSFSFAVLGWSSKSFDVCDGSGFSIRDDAQGVPYFGYDLALRETDANAYVWTAAEEAEVPAAPASNLPNPFAVKAPTGLTLTSGEDQVEVRPDGAVLARIHAAWTAPADQYVTNGGHIESQYKRDWETVWRNGPTVPGATIVLDIFDVQADALFDVRIRSTNAVGATSAWVTGQVTAIDYSRLASPKYGEMMLANLVERYNPKNFNLTSIAYGNGLFVAVGDPDGGDAYILSSRFGVVWTERSNPKNFGLNKIIWVPELSKFFAVGDADTGDAYILSSSNGTAWTEEANPKNYTLNDIAWSPSLALLVAVGVADTGDAYIVSSTGNGTWTERANAKNIGLNRVIWVPELSKFFAVGNADGVDAYILSSSNGTAWTEEVNPKNYALLDVVWSPTLALLVAVGVLDDADNYLITSTGNGTWTERATGAVGASEFDSVVWNASLGIFVAGGGNTGSTGQLFSSTDGVTWTSRTVPATTGHVWRLETVGDIFVGVGNLHKLISSDDGINWVSYTTPGAGALKDIIYAAGLFVGVGAADGTDAAIAS